jgi:hypothetical protein
MNSKITPEYTEMMIEHLQKLAIESRPWIARKEVAAWSAAVLHITILIALLNFFSKGFPEKHSGLTLRLSKKVWDRFKEVAILLGCSYI